MPLLFSLLSAMIVCGLIWMARRQPAQSFGDWWNAEGLPICMIVTVLAFAIGAGLSFWR